MALTVESIPPDIPSKTFGFAIDDLLFMIDDCSIRLFLHIYEFGVVSAEGV
jgi:hypothetical protein